jgi:alpha-beta hydrolase superfamily lysophospholipase
MIAKMDEPLRSRRAARTRLRRLAAALLLCLALGAAASWAAGSVMTSGRHSRVRPAEPPATDFFLEAADGTRVAATFRPGRTGRSPAVLLLHGVRASRDATAPTAVWLSALGYASLTIDFRGHGASDLAPRTFGLHEAMDAEAAFRWLKRRQRGAPVAIIGTSLGGAAALLGEKGPLPADALVLQAVYPDIRRAISNRIAARLGRPAARLLEPLLSYQSLPRLGIPPSRLSPLRALRRYRGPVLVIGGLDDRYTPPDETRARFSQVSGPRALWLVPGKDHAALGDLADETYRRRLSLFLERTIGRP